MTNSKKFIRDYEFNDDTPKELEKDGFYIGWPVVYLINNDKELYVGETYHAPERMKQHLERKDRRRLNKLHIIGDTTFTKSSTLDIESSLIELCQIEDKYKLQNENAGLINHNYANKDYFRKDSIFFSKLWKELQQRGLVEGNIENILNSDLFKYSPYKALNAEQCTTRDYILKDIEECLKENKNRTIFVNGSAGTGKTILAVYLMKLFTAKGDYLLGSKDYEEDVLPFVETLNSIKKIKPDLKIGYVVAMESLRNTLKEVFKQIDGLKKNMVIGPGEVVNGNYDILIVDEAHRLKRRKNLENGTVYGSFDRNNEKLGLGEDGTQLDWILKESKIQILFYDEEQTIKPTDVPKERFDEIRKISGNSWHNLSSQMRCLGGLNYIKYVKNILNKEQHEKISFDDKYDLCLYKDIDNFCNAILEKENKEGLSRIVAGYGFEWNNKKEMNRIFDKGKISEIPNIAEIKDIRIEDKSFYWNRHSKGWPISIKGEQVINEFGCVHTIQGYDLNYCGVVFGPEILYRDGRITIDRNSYYDVNGKAGTTDKELKDYIINIYSVLLTRGIRGTYVYACDEELRDYLSKYIPYKD